jgi:hypothetical protein
MSEHKEVNLESILPQFSGGLQNQENVMPQSRGMSVQSNQRTTYKKFRLDSVLLQVNGVQHTRRSVSTVSCRRSVVSCRIKLEIKSSRVPRSKPTSILTRCRHSHRSSANNPQVGNNPNNTKRRMNFSGNTSRLMQLPAFSQFS